MEFWARWAHRALWHASLWHMHEVRHFEYKKEETCTYDNMLMKNNIDNGLQSHHRPRNGPFELNDVFAVINAVPAIALFSYGFFNKGLLPGLCFGAVSESILSLFCLQRSRFSKFLRF